MLIEKCGHCGTIVPDGELCPLGCDEDENGMPKFYNRKTEYKCKPYSRQRRTQAEGIKMTNECVCKFCRSKTHKAKEAHICRPDDLKNEILRLKTLNSRWNNWAQWKQEQISLELKSSILMLQNDWNRLSPVLDITPQPLEEVD